MASLLDRCQQGQLLSVARDAIAARLAGRRYAPPEVTDVLRQKRGAFVSLHTPPSTLRGCIGYIEPVLPLIDVVVRAAQAAAFEDPRFPPLGAEELARVQIEISVLSVPAPVRPEDVQVGTHGLIVERGRSRGLLLPQVATEYGWDRETFLSHTCRKAGLPSAAWRDPDASILAFSAEVFGEADVSGLAPA